MVIAVLSAFAGGCAPPPAINGSAGVSPSPSREWVPPRDLKPAVREVPPPVIPPALMQHADSLNLAELIDVALTSSSQTRGSWAAARSAAAAYGSQKGEWYPQITLSGNATVQGSDSSHPRRTYGPAASFDWLLFNFGGRLAAVEETRQALIAADWTHNATIQNVILQVQQAYYDYVTTKALLNSESATLNEAQSNLDAAQARRQAGLATIADVLQAQTALSQVQLSFQTLQGQIAITRGALATSMGVTANIPFDVVNPPDEPPMQQIGDQIDRYLDEARVSRPDLAAARALADRAQAHVRRIRADGLPSISAVGNAGRTFFDNPNDHADNYLAAIEVRWPFFTGFSHHYDVRQAQADADAALARLQGVEQTADLQVWTSYYAVRTAEQRYHTSQDLMKSASQSYSVALGRYREGVGTILDVLTAQAALEQARALLVQARADWFVSLAQLAHDTGTLSTTTPGAPVGGTGPGKQER